MPRNDHNLQRPASGVDRKKGRIPAAKATFRANGRRDAGRYVRSLFPVPCSLLLLAVIAGAAPPTSAPVNLLRNGDFETPHDTGHLPAGWSTKHPDNVRRLDFGDPFACVVQMRGDRELMAHHGTDLLSDPIPIQPNTRYRCSGYTRSEGPQIKVFVRGYDTVSRRVNGQLTTFDDTVYTMRKDIPPSPTWQPFSLDFEVTPADIFSDHQHTVRYVRIKLWAYWPAGTCWFDNIRFEALGPQPARPGRPEGALTHTGRLPRLGPTATQPAQPLDPEQTWREAVNALRTQRFAQACSLARQLLQRSPENGTYRVLLARSLAGLEQWTEAEEVARTLLSPSSQPAIIASRPATSARSAAEAAPAIAPWQRDWARLVVAQARYHLGDAVSARKLLEALQAPDVSPHVRHRARERLDQWSKP
jgi:hypothetical protein